MELAVLPFTIQDLGWISFASAVLLSAILTVRLIVAVPVRARHRTQPAHASPESAGQPAAERAGSHL